MTITMRSIPAEAIVTARSSSPDSFTQRSFDTYSSGTITPNTTTTHQEENDVLFDADSPQHDEKQNRLLGDEVMSSKHYRDSSPVPLDETRCSILPGKLAVWSIKGTNIRLCALAATVLVHRGKIGVNDLEV
jgi:hypothetical protein